MSKETVLVLEAESKSAVPIIESCAAQGLYVIAASFKKYGCGLYTRGTKEKLRYPCPEKYPDRWVEFMVDFVRDREISLMFPTGDLITYLVAKNQDQFARHTKVILPALDVFVQGRDKILTLHAARRAGCPRPKTWYPQ